VKPERILIVGSGSMAQRHFDIANKIFPDSMIANFTSREQVMDFPLTLSSREEVIKFAPNISVIATTANLHLENAIFLAKLGSHLLIEKPISINLDGIENLIQIQRQQGINILVGYNLEYLPSLRKFKTLIMNESVGKILDVKIEVGQDLLTWRPNRDYKSTASANRHLGGGVLRELSHEIHYFLGIFGNPKWVFATLNKFGDLEIDVEDTAHIIFGMQDQRENKFNASLHLDFVRKHKTRTCTVVGNSGTLTWNLLNGRIDKRSGDSASHETLSEGIDVGVDTYKSEWDDLLNCISNNTEPRNSVISAAQTLEIVLACEESDKRESKVFLPNNSGRSNWEM
jgi:predicted dehydrogenase